MLLTKKKRRAYFKYLGLGEYNKANIKKFEQRYLPAKHVDGSYGVDTDRLLRHVYNVKRYTDNFTPQEFKCRCGKCTGYPTFMRKHELQNVQRIRDFYGKPMTITSGLRCKAYNSTLVGSSKNSNHMKGRAVDFYAQGVTDTLANRKRTLTFLRRLPFFNYAYGNGCSSLGYVYAPNMGNAMHVDSR